MGKGNDRRAHQNRYSGSRVETFEDYMGRVSSVMRKFLEGKGRASGTGNKSKFGSGESPNARHNSSFSFFRR